MKVPGEREKLTLQETVGMIDVVEMSEDGGKQGWDAEQTTSEGGTALPE